MIVEYLPPKFEKRLSDFVLTIRTLLGTNLKGVILYGSAARGEFDPRRSDLNLLVVLNEVDFRHLALLAPHTRKWYRKRISTPLVLSPHYISTAVDVYPLEFLEMQFARKVLFGEDVLAQINPPLQAIRRQCEQEARGKLLHLREILLETALKPRHLKQAMILSVPSFIRIGRHILRLQGQAPKVHAKEVIEALRDSTQVPLQGLEAAWSIKTGEHKPSRGEIANLFETYLNDTVTITNYVDTLKVE
ncbi:MAG: nucleotidyltransferase domain-containing protein [Candidatus Binatia bacterium]